MKHNLKITLLLLGMFVLTQFIGMAILSADIFHIQHVSSDGIVTKSDNPYMVWISPPEPQTQTQAFGIFSQIIFSFVIAVLLIVFLSKFKIQFFMKAWFFFVVSIALFLSFYAISKLAGIISPQLIIIGICASVALVLAYFKVYQRNFLLHNLTEFLIYPGIANVFVAILNIYTIVIFLVIISIYDAWAVWHSGIMQKMAKYQINQLKIFSGFFVPYMSKRMKAKVQSMKEKFSNSEMKKKKIKVNIAMLGGGDIIFPIITSGIMLQEYGLTSALMVTAGATAGLAYLFFFAEKKKFYPAMPFITAGMFVAMILSYILL